MFNFLNLTKQNIPQYLFTLQSELQTFDLEFYIQSHIRVIIMCIPFIVTLLFISFINIYEQIKQFETVITKHKHDISKLHHTVCINKKDHYKIKKMNKQIKNLNKLQNELQCILMAKINKIDKKLNNFNQSEYQKHSEHSLQIESIKQELAGLTTGFTVSNEL